MSDELAILVPVLNRPQNVAPLLSSIRAATPGAYVLFVLDPDDDDEHAAIVAADKARLRVGTVSPGGSYAAKINAGVRRTITPLVFLGADDLHFHPGWLQAARAAMAEGVGCVGTQDLCNRRVIRGEHATHFLLARWYAEQPCIDGSPGPLFEGYAHEFVDDELIGTARKRGVYAFAGGAVVEHLHPDAGKAPRDALYDAQGERMERSRPLYNERRKLWT